MHYLKLTWRLLTKNRIYSLINISGLAIGLSVCMLIVLYVAHESRYDRFHKNAERIYWIQGKIKMGSDSIFVASMSYPTGPLVQQNEPSVESFLRYKTQSSNTVVQNPADPSLKFAEEKFMFADSNFFDFFSFKLIKGSKQSVLKNPYSVVISTSIVEKYFGTDDPVGKTIRYNNKYDFLVTGVAEKIPSNSSIEFDFVASLSSMTTMPEEKRHIAGQVLENGSFSTYFLLKNANDVPKLETRLQQMHKATSNEKDEDKVTYFATGLTDTHLNANYADKSNIKYLRIFPFVAALVLLLALINYISLTTARASARAKEIGVRKVLGAGRRKLAIQFFIESAVFTAIALALGYLLCMLFQPVFFKYLEIEVDTEFLYNPIIVVSFAGIFLVSVLLAASYPSLVLSAFRPVMILYGKINKHAGEISVKKLFTVVQFTISIVLVICSMVIMQQVKYLKNTDTGVNKENIVMVPFSSPIGKNYAAFKSEIGSIAGIGRLATSQVAMYKGNDIMGVKPKNSDKMMFLPILSVDENFVDLLGLEWKMAPGDPFYLRKDNTILLNETALEKLNLGADPLNQMIDDQYTVAGVLKDFNYYSLQDKIESLGLIMTSDKDTAAGWSKRGGCLFAKINPNTNLPGLLSKMKSVYDRYDNAKPFTYQFMDEAFDDLYRAEDRLSRILGVFTLFMILIACLGLFGLTTFMIVQRTREIGIRKVLGASVSQLSAMLSRDFVKMVLIAVLIASPIAWWATNKWLEDFAYRINIGWWVFVLAGIGAVLIAIITISIQTIRAALANPVKSLRSE